MAFSRVSWAHKVLDCCAESSDLLLQVDCKLVSKVSTRNERVCCVRKPSAASYDAPLDVMDAGSVLNICVTRDEPAVGMVK